MITNVETRGTIRISHVFVDRIIRIFHECEVLIENLSQGSQFGITRLRRVMPNCDPRDRFVDQYLKLRIDSFSCTPMGANT